MNAKCIIARLSRINWRINSFFFFFTLLWSLSSATCASRCNQCEARYVEAILIHAVWVHRHIANNTHVLTSRGNTFVWCGIIKWIMKIKNRRGFHETIDKTRTCGANGERAGTRANGAVPSGQTRLPISRRNLIGYQVSNGPNHTRRCPFKSHHLHRCTYSDEQCQDASLTDSDELSTRSSSVPSRVVHKEIGINRLTG